jgi:hypothetical protein
LKTVPGKKTNDDEDGGSDKGHRLARKIARAVIDGGTIWWMLGHDDEAATNLGATIVIVLLKVVRVIL